MATHLIHTFFLIYPSFIWFKHIAGSLISHRYIWPFTLESELELEFLSTFDKIWTMIHKKWYYSELVKNDLSLKETRMVEDPIL